MDGRRVFVRPCDISSVIDGQHIIRIDTGRPDCDISVTELLIGLLAVAFGPRDRREWSMRYENPPNREDIEVALRPLEPAMLFDGEGPRYFQDLEKIEGEPT